MATFEERYIELWEAFVTFSNDTNHSDADVILKEEQFDKDVEDLAVKFSHPPGRPNRRR